MKTRAVDVVETTCEVLLASTFPAAIQRRESVHATMPVRRSADASKKSPDKDSSKASLFHDAHALSALYERFWRPIHSYIYPLLGSQEDADAVTQEVFVRAFTAWDGLYDRDNLSAWLNRIATNVSVDLLRQRKHISWGSLTPHKRGDEHFHGALSDESFFLSPDDGGIPAIAEREHIQLAIANLPEEYAVALVLNAAQGVSYKEVAAVAWDDLPGSSHAGTIPLLASLLPAGAHDAPLSSVRCRLTSVKPSSARPAFCNESACI